MKKLSIALCILMVAVFLFTLVGCDRPQEPDTLVVYNWADYIYDYEDDFKAYYRQVFLLTVKDFGAALNDLIS